MVTTTRTDEAGFSLVELLISMAIALIVLGSALGIATVARRTSQYQLEDVEVQEEARFALEWITQEITSAGSNPYSVNITNCPVAGTAVVPVRLDPDADGVPDDVRVQTDAGRPNGFIVGQAGACNEPNEDITIALDAANRVITRFDAAVDAAPVAMTDAIFTQLQFSFRDANFVVTAVPGSIRFVRIAVQGQSRGRNPYTGQFTTFSLQRDVRLRAR
jgi:prepilin-type N-terminal cleavage/methylation domain-containing protein